MWKVLIPLALVLTGCAAAKVRSASERSVVVFAPGGNVGEAQALAEAECAKHARKARLSGQLNNGNYVFDCER